MDFLNKTKQLLTYICYENLIDICFERLEYKHYAYKDIGSNKTFHEFNIWFDLITQSYDSHLHDESSYEDI